MKPFSYTYTLISSILLIFYVLTTFQTKISSEDRKMSWYEPHLSYLPYLSFVEYVIALISQIVAITLLSYLALCFLFNRKRMTVDTLSKSMLVYLFYHIIFSPFGILYHGYMVIKWRPEFNNYDTNVVFWLGIFGVSYYAISPIPGNNFWSEIILSKIVQCNRQHTCATRV